MISVAFATALGPLGIRAKGLLAAAWMLDGADHVTVEYGRGRPDEVERRSTAVSAPWSGLVRWIVGLLLIGHGLIHVLGPLATWGLAEIEALSGDPTIDIGAATNVVALAWLIALLMLVMAGAAVMARRVWWRTLAAIGVIVSQATIFVWWDDAATGTVANLLVVAAVVFARPLGLDFRAADGSG